MRLCSSKRCRNTASLSRNLRKKYSFDVYLKAISADVVLTSEFIKMMVKINKPASECTLHEVRKLKYRRKSISSVVQCLHWRYLRELSSAGAGIPCQLCGVDTWSLYSCRLPSHTSPVRCGPQSTMPLNPELTSGEVGIFTLIITPSLPYPLII